MSRVNISSLIANLPTLLSTRAEGLVVRVGYWSLATLKIRVVCTTSTTIDIYWKENLVCAF